MPGERGDVLIECFRIHGLIYLPYEIGPMNGTISRTKNLLSATNIAAYLFALLGATIIAISQTLAILIPLMMPPLVCGTLCLTLYNLQSKDQTDQSSGPTPNVFTQN